MAKESKYWIKQTISWLVDRRPIFLMKYDDLKSNLTGVLREAAKFLDLNTTDAILECTKTNSEGSYHRTTDPKQPDLLVFPEDQLIQLNEKKAIVDRYVGRRCPSPPWCLSYAQVDFTGLNFSVFSAL